MAATGVGLLGSLVRRHPGLVLGSLALTLVAALLEGSTIGLFAMALESLSEAAPADTASAYGRLAAEVDRWRDGLGTDRFFLTLVGLAVLAQLARSVLEYLGRLLGFRLLVRAEGEIRGRLFRLFMHRPFARIQGHKLGDLSSYIEQTVYVGQTVQRLTNLANQLLLLAVYLLLLLWLSWPMTLAAVVAGSALSLGLRGIVRRVRRIGRQHKSATVTLSERAVEYLAGLRLVRIFAREQYAVERVDSAIWETARARLKVLSWQALVSPVVDCLTVIGVAGFLVGGYLLTADQGVAALPRLATFLFVLYRLAPRIRVVNDNYAFLASYVPFLDRIASMLETASEDRRGDGRPYAGLRREIVLEGVSMRYDAGDRAAVEEVSFAIPRGAMVGLVGESGAGKSTLADLLIGLYRPTGGRILVDGADLAGLSWADWRKRIGSVDQNTFIFHASVRDNIAFGRPAASEEEIVAAARAAHADEFICELADGYATVVGDQGYKLSGGQRQRLAIARAILRQPDLLIFDEATSDLDSHSERLIQEAIGRLRGRCTIVAIAHRLSTIAGADFIVVLERGRVAESGTHEELLASQGPYARLWRLQSAPSSPNLSLAARG